MMEFTIDKPILDVDDIRKYLGVSRNSAYDLCRSGQFRVLRIGQRIKVPTESFLNWVNGSN